MRVFAGKVYDVPPGQVIGAVGPQVREQFEHRLVEHLPDRRDGRAYLFFFSSLRTPSMA
jgi:hypothetical protein